MRRAGILLIILSSLLCSLALGEDAAFKSFEVPTPFAFAGRLDIDKATGNVWFVEANSNKLGRFEPEKQHFTEYEIPTMRSLPSDIVIGNQGKVWFTEQDANQLGVFDPDSSTFKEYDVPTIESLPYRIAVDASGNIWFTEFYGNKVGMFDTRKEQFREYSVPTPDSRPTGIVVDDKMGLIWFIETEGNKLARLDPRDGKIREFALPTSFEAPGDLAIDISGSLWFGGNKSRILMAFDPQTEKFETFPVPKRGVTEGLAAGFDGKIVCSFKNFGSIGVFDPATRKLMEVNLGSSKSKPKDIAIDAKGDIWFADLGMNALFWLDGKMVPKLWLK